MEPEVAPTRRLAAIMSADLAGYSRLMRLDEEGTLAALRDLRRSVLDPAIQDHGGRIVKTMGDGLLIEFPSIVDAIRCGIHVQSNLIDRNARLPVERRMEFRIGLNVGDIIDIGGDVFGDAVNVASRLEAVADPGGICISQAALQQASGKVDMTTEDLGDVAMKNIDVPVRVYRLRRAQATAPVQRSDASRTVVYDAPPERPSLAILPFHNLGVAPESAIVANGIALGLQTLLVQLPNMFFVNACDHQAYRSGKCSAAEALAHMPVRYAVEGWVQHAGDRVRLNVQVSDLENHSVLWAQQYDRTMVDVFALQDEIARNIAGALCIELIGNHVGRDFTGSLDSPDAWEHFLRGVNLFYRMTKSDHAQAIGHFRSLAEAHPDNAIGACYLSVLYYYGARRGWAASFDAAIREAEEWAKRAIALEDGNNGVGHAVLGAIALSRHDHETSLKLCHTAVGYRANCPFAHLQLGITQTYLGDHEAGLRNIRKAISFRHRGPLPSELDALAIAYRDQGDVDRSISAAEEATQIDPQFVDAFVTLSSDLILTGQTERARQTAQDILRVKPAFSVADFIALQPYLEPGKLERIATTLRQAGLPD